ncbi:MAG: polysaccharide biosynthesis C-terminal domain-containing protein [Oscillospiraceae bacterium]|jgi:stage V sporulation protein B|nr:polysaccharide biosynthesis C-terminal domain-containing protein [Oscillospiraceae bacterium]
METTRTRQVIRNTLLLTGAALLMRSAGVWFNALLENRAGASGVGLFGLLMSVYSLAVTFGCAGVRLSAMRLTAEENDVRRRGGGMGKCFFMALLLGILAAVILYFAADICAERWLHDSRAAESLRILAPSIPAIALSAALNGYCTSAGAVLPFALVQLVEQGIKIAITLFALKNFSGASSAFSLGPYGSDNSGAVCAAMAMGITAAEWISCAMSFGVYALWGLRQKRAEDPKTPLQALLRIALPDGLGAFARGILLTAEHLLIPHGLRKSGANSEEALSSYGTIHGMALPLLLYPSALMSALAGLLVPELARLRTNRHPRRIADVSSQLIHWTLTFSLGTAVISFAFAPELSSAVYGSHVAADSLRLLAPLVPIMYLDMTVDGILKGLDEQKKVMFYNVLDSLLCVAMVLLVLPPLGVKGYYLVLYASELLNFTLSANRLLNVSDARLKLWESMGKPLLCSGGAIAVTRLLFGTAVAGMSPLLSAVLLLGWAVTLFFVLINVFSKKSTRLAELIRVR